MPTVYVIDYYTQDEGCLEEWHPTLKEAKKRAVWLIREDRNWAKTESEKREYTVKPEVSNVRIHRVKVDTTNIRLRKLVCNLLNRLRYESERTLVWGKKEEE
jgi:hypothetical protein